MSIVLFLFSIVFLIIIHECGHFVVARILHFKIERFAIGFGKPWWRKTTKSGIEYSFAPIILGGYVKMDDKDYPLRPVWSRMLVMLAGVATNIIVAVMLFWLVFTIGIATPKAIIGTVVPNSIAFKAGLHAGEKITTLDGVSVHNWQEVSLALILRLGDKGVLTINGRNLSLVNWSINELKPDPIESLGIIPYVPKAWSKELLHQEHYGLGKALLAASYKVWQLWRFNIIVISKIVRGQISLQVLGGPLTIFSAANQAFAAGYLIYLSFLALLSIMLALVNLLPIPGLDGGNFLLLVIEAVIRRPINAKMQAIILRLGYLLLATLVFVALGNDLLRLFL